MKTVRIAIFTAALIFIAVSIFSITIARYLPVEFAHWEYRNLYYDVITIGFPFAILLTPFGTIKKKYSAKTNYAITGITIVASVFLSFIVFFMAIDATWGEWENNTILYRHYDDENHTINEQALDMGVLGNGGIRIVEIKPFLKFWKRIEEVDTTAINKQEWEFVNAKNY